MSNEINTSSKRKTGDYTLSNENRPGVDNSRFRRFRWSCFSFINKLKTPKLTSDIPISKVFEDVDLRPTIHEEPSKLDEGHSTAVSIWKPSPIQLPPSLSPPPRQLKSKRESMTIQQRKNNDSSKYLDDQTNHKKSRRPLMDPTLTPRVRPKNSKSVKQPSFLRLSLDSEMVNSIEAANNDNLSIDTLRVDRSSISLTPTGNFSPQAPFRSGTLGASSCQGMTSNDTIPPLPNHIPMDQGSFTFQSRPNSQLTTSNISTIESINSRNSSVSNHMILDSPASLRLSRIDIDEDEEQKLTIKERRSRRSPLSMPNSDQLTLALKEMSVEDQKTRYSVHSNSSSFRRHTHDIRSTYISQLDDILDRKTWSQQNEVVSDSNQSREEAMLILEGKISTSPNFMNRGNTLVSVSEKPHDNSTSTSDVVQKENERDCVAFCENQQGNWCKGNQINYKPAFINYPTVDETSDVVIQINNETVSKKKFATSQKGQQTCSDVTCKGKMMAYPTKGLTSSTHFNLLSTPDTPPYHRNNAPSLIFSPSTPNSIDSSVIEHEDYITA